VWKIRDFSATQILREINLGLFEAPKSAILAISVALNFEFLGFLLTCSSVKFPKIKTQKLQKWFKLFHVKSKWQEFSLISTVCLLCYSVKRTLHSVEI